MCSLVEILCLLEEKFGLVCLQLPHDLHATEIFGVQPSCTSRSKLLHVDSDVTGLSSQVVHIL